MEFDQIIAKVTDFFQTHPLDRHCGVGGRGLFLLQKPQGVLQTSGLFGDTGNRRLLYLAAQQHHLYQREQQGRIDP